MRETIIGIMSRLRVALLAGALVAAGSSLAFSKIGTEAKDAKITPVRLRVDQTAAPRSGGMVASFSEVVKAVTPSVVQVFTTSTPKAMGSGGLPEDPFFRRFFGEGLGSMPRPVPREGIGSGVIVTEDGYILTNNHVIENADEVRVALMPDGREYPATVVGRDPKTDVAVLKIDAEGLPHATVGDSAALEIGDVVLAVGNPFGIGQTVTMGIVSAMGRGNVGLAYEDFIQTDAAINPGNSGGALVDAAGRLVGVNTAILSRSGGNDGIGFAIPINLARNVLESLIEHGRVVRGFLGVGIQDLTPELAKAFGAGDARGVLVSEVTEKSAAMKAGLKSGDVLTKFHGTPVRDSRHLRLKVAQTAPGETVKVSVLRKGKEQELDVTLQELPDDRQMARIGSDTPAQRDPLDGVAVKDIERMDRAQAGLPRNTEGALVVRVAPGSRAYAAGLRPGDVILELDREPVRNADETIAASEKAGNEVLLRIWSRGGTRFLVVKQEAKVG